MYQIWPRLNFDVRTAEVDLDENRKKAFLENKFSLNDFYTLDRSILEKYIFQLNEDQ